MNSIVKWLITSGIIFVIFSSFYGITKGFYNTSIELQQDTKTSWGNVESSYQRRNDLIGNLVQTVQGAANFEKSTLTARLMVICIMMVAVIEARAKVTAVNIDPSKVTTEQLEIFQKSQTGLSSALSRLMFSVERYPDLQSNQNFLRLQAELEGTENRIKTARDRYNASVEPYNVHILSFPNSFINSFIGHFTELPYFKSYTGVEKNTKC